MNAEDAYRLHTDWARAVLKPDTPTHAWFQRRLTERCQPLTPGSAESALFRSLSEPRTFDGMLATGPAVTTKLVVDWKPTDPDAQTPPTDVFPEAQPDPEPLSVSAEAVVIPEHIYTDAVPTVLAGAPTYYVTADMCTVMEVAAEAFDAFDLMPQMPASSGFVVLARPIHLPMPGGTTQPVRAFAWDTWGDINTSMGTSGMVGEVWTFASRRHDADFEMVTEAAASWPSKKAWTTEPDLLPCYADWLVTGVPVGPLTETVAEGAARQHWHDWLSTRSARYQRTGNLPDAEEWTALVTAARARYDQHLAAATETDRSDRYGYWQPYLAAFVLLLTQQITVTRDNPAPEDAVRLARKVNTRRSSAVTVVDIRSTRHGSEPAEPDSDERRKRGPLTHRHLVGAHWKWQPYGKDRALRRRIFVSGYVRGPEDKPLVVKPRVTRL